MANTVYMSKTGLIGGEATKLDSIDGAGLVDNDAAFVNVSNVQYIYRLDADSAAVEASPNIIAPDTNAGDKRWILQTISNTMLNGAIEGDGTAGRVLRVSQISIQDGTDAAHVKCTLGSIWNGDSAIAQDNIGKDGVPTGIWSLDAGGQVLSLLPTGITGDCIAVLSAIIYRNFGATLVSPYIRAYASGILISFIAAPSAGAALDMTTLVDSGAIDLIVTYLTSA